MKKFGLFSVLLICLLALGLVLASCDGSDSNATKFQGTWHSRDPSNQTLNVNTFVFTGNNFSYKAIFNGNEIQAFSGTFTFTDTSIIFTHTTGTSAGHTFQDPYTLSGNNLWIGGFGSFMKE